MEATPTSQRRGSAISISVQRPNQQTTNAAAASPNAIALQQQQAQQYGGAMPPMMPGYPNPYMMPSPNYPVLMNPPPMPTYAYGIPPQPMPMYGPPMPPPQQQPNMRRSGSMRMVAQDTRRPFTSANGQMPGVTVSEADYGIMGGEDFQYNAARAPTDTPNSTLPRNYTVRKNEVGEQNGDGGGVPPYPGVIIEEMFDSASMAGDLADQQNNQQVALINDKQDEATSVLGQNQFSAAIPQRAPVRWKHNTPMNTLVMFVPQQEAWVVERMGKFHRILDPGLNVLIPIVDKIKYVQSLKEIAIDIPQQTAITIDNVTLNIDGVLYLRVKDPYKASYGVEDPEFAITQLAQTTMRSEIGKITLDTLFRERESLNLSIVTAINTASDAWGIECMRYEIRDIRMPARVQEAMQMQVEAERKKRAAILESEGIKSAEINVAEGKKQARILSSEAEKQELINAAQGAAEAVIAAGNARAKSIEMVSKSLCEANGQNAAGLAVAEKYVTAFQSLAKTNNTLILPANTGDVTSMVAQAMSIYTKLKVPDHQPQGQVLETVPEEDPTTIDATSGSQESEQK